MPIPGARIYQRRPGRLVIPVDLRLGQAGGLVGAAPHHPQLGRQPPLRHLQQPPDRRAQQRDGVHGGDRVLQRGGVQHPPHPDQPSLPGRSHGDLKDPLWSGRGGQPRPHVHQHGMAEAGVVKGQPTAGVLPAGVEAERLDCLAVRQPCNRCSTITVATIRGGTLRRPTSANRSANSSSPNSRSLRGTAPPRSTGSRRGPRTALPCHATGRLAWGSHRLSSATPGPRITSM